MSDQELNKRNKIMEYVQSANTLFHFMKQMSYLTKALSNKGLVPRYCEEDIGYLEIQGLSYNKINILEKCFCDIPFHKLADNIPIRINDNGKEKIAPEDIKKLQKRNTHLDYYGRYAIAFSKEWCIEKNLQPVHYINTDAEYAKEYGNLLEQCINRGDDLPDYIEDNILNGLMYFKPLSGIMSRSLDNNTHRPVEVEKNFHDEKEWRYIPQRKNLERAGKKPLIYSKLANFHSAAINSSLEEEQYRYLWLEFDYDDIRYIIVPDATSRIDLIKFIIELPKGKFKTDIDIDLQRYILISKILVLDEIRRDW